MMLQSAKPYSDEPPEAHTGGFGEPTCLDCHMDFDLNPPGGALTVTGWPAAPTPEAEYTLVVKLRGDVMERAGFQLAVRHADSTQAGSLTSIDDRVQIQMLDGILYASQTEPGSFAVSDSSTWTVRWTAPGRVDSISVHVAANAANGDDSPFEDRVYTWSK